MADNDIVLSVSNVTAGYNKPLLNNVSFEVRRGEIFVLLGGSGCGKSTMLKHIIGLVPPLGGEIRLNGNRLFGGSAEEAESARHSFGVTYQSGALFGSMTLIENVCVPLESFTRLPPEARLLTARMRLQQVGLDAYADFFPSEISGGMCKRAAGARPESARDLSR